MIYLDHCATTAVDPAAASLACEIMVNSFGNPSSLHYLGGEAYGLLQDARSRIARMISAQNDCICFTSGGTESNNLAIQGAATARGRKEGHIITTMIEHSSVLDACRYLEQQGFRVTYVRPDRVTHRIRAEDVLRAVRPDTILISMMLVNNETGELLPVPEVTERIKAIRPDILVHTDLVQAYGKFPFKLYQCKVDLATASSHKIHGPKGAGMLYVRRGCTVRPFRYGGSQEHGINPGTENVPAYCAFGLAADLLLGKIKENQARVEALNRHLRQALLARFPEMTVNSPEGSSPYVLNVSLPGYKSSEIVDYCSLRDVYLSAGSACRRGARSHVLEAMGLDEERIAGALRISLGPENTICELNTLVNTLSGFAQEKRKAV